MGAVVRGLPLAAATEHLGSLKFREGAEKVDGQSYVGMKDNSRLDPICCCLVHVPVSSSPVAQRKRSMWC